MDTLGLLWSVVVHAADEQDRSSAPRVLEPLCKTCPRLQRVYADSGYTGELGDWVKSRLGIPLEIVKRSELVKGFKLLAKRWIVERTFAWFNRFRRLSKDYEIMTDTVVWYVRLAMIAIMLNRLVQ